MTSSTHLITDYLDNVDAARTALERIKEQQQGFCSDLERIAGALRSLAAAGRRSGSENSASGFQE